jgi:hypothetical protein
VMQIILLFTDFLSFTQVDDSIPRVLLVGLQISNKSNIENFRLDCCRKPLVALVTLVPK